MFIAGGVGITPIIPMIEQARFLDIPWTLIYGGRRRRLMAFLEDLLSLDADSVQVFPQDEVGILNLVPVFSNPEPGTKFYGCGPAPMLDAVQKHAAEAGWPRQALCTERFVSRDLNASPRTRPGLGQGERTNHPVDVDDAPVAGVDGLVVGVDGLVVRVDRLTVMVNVAVAVCAGDSLSATVTVIV